MTWLIVQRPLVRNAYDASNITGAPSGREVRNGRSIEKIHSDKSVSMIIAKREGNQRQGIGTSSANIYSLISKEAPQLDIIKFHDVVLNCRKRFATWDQYKEIASNSILACDIWETYEAAYVKKFADHYQIHRGVPKQTKFALSKAAALAAWEDAICAVKKMLSEQEIKPKAKEQSKIISNLKKLEDKVGMQTKDALMPNRARRAGRRPYLFTAQSLLRIPQ